FSTGDDNGFSHSISQIKAFKKGPKSNQPNNWTSYYIGAQKNHEDTLEVCVEGSFIVFKAGDDGKYDIEDYDYRFSSCNRTWADSTVHLQAVTPRYLTEENFYFTQVDEHDDTGITKVSYNQLFKQNNTPDIVKIEPDDYASWDINWDESKLGLDDGRSIMTHYKWNDKDLSYAGTWWMSDHRYDYQYAKRVDGITGVLAKDSVPKVSSENYLGTFLNVQLAKGAFIDFGRTCTMAGLNWDYYNCVDNETGEFFEHKLIGVPSIHNKEKTIFTFTDIYGTESEVTISYDNNFDVQL
ncbi:hypothetical protein C1141_20105, partial [Vibrio agarivorans]